MTQQEVHDLIREHGGIVHGDGNIFFTNAVQFGLVVSAMKPEPSQEYAERPTDEQIAEYGRRASRMMAQDQTRFDAACEVMHYLKKEAQAPYYYLHRMSIVLHGNTEGTAASKAPDATHRTTAD